MANYSIYKVGDKWAIKRHGATRVSEYVDTKEDAHARARELVENTGGGDVFEHASRDGSVHDRGQIIDRDTYGIPDPRGNG